MEIDLDVKFYSFVDWNVSYFHSPKLISVDINKITKIYQDIIGKESIVAIKTSDNGSTYFIVRESIEEVYAELKKKTEE